MSSHCNVYFAAFLRSSMQRTVVKLFPVQTFPAYMGDGSVQDRLTSINKGIVDGVEGQPADREVQADQPPLTSAVKGSLCNNSERAHPKFLRYLRGQATRCLFDPEQYFPLF